MGIFMGTAMLICGAACAWRTLAPNVGIEALSTQYVRSVLVSYPRGTIYDRNGIPFTNRHVDGYDFFEVSCGNDSVAAYITGATDIEKDNTTADACRGVSGLQQRYDKILAGGSPVTVSAYVDAEGNVLEENGYYVINDHPNEGGNITLTLDYNLQKSCENAMRKYAQDNAHERISAIVSDVGSGELLAMVSYGGFMNNAVLSYQPGSIMKILTAAVAYDMGIIDDNTRYTCSGTVKVGEEERHCYDNAVHGDVTIAEAFAHSCNCCFYKLAQKLVYTNSEGETKSHVLDKAKQWGFTEFGDIPSDRFILEYDEHYSFVASDIYNDMDVFNAALGQGRVQASAYTINAITSAIAAGGVGMKPYIVNTVSDAAGNNMPSEEKKLFNLSLKPETVTWLKGAMQLTGSEGTACSNTLGEYGGLSGKTGTAENIQDSPAHAWFTGYFPLAEPKYAITVVIENGGYGGNAVNLADILAHETLKIYK